jgi:hypothetical protein
LHESLGRGAGQDRAEADSDAHDQQSDDAPGLLSTAANAVPPARIVMNVWLLSVADYIKPSTQPFVQIVDEATQHSNRVQATRTRANSNNGAHGVPAVAHAALVPGGKRVASASAEAQASSRALSRPDRVTRETAFASVASPAKRSSA